MKILVFRRDLVLKYDIVGVIYAAIYVYIYTHMLHFKINFKSNSILIRNSLVMAQSVNDIY